MRRPESAGLCVLVAVFLTACQTEERTPSAAGLTQVRKEVSIALQRYTDASRAVDADASSKFFTATGVLFEPGIPPIQGPDSIRAFISSFPGVQVDSATTTADVIEVFGDTAFVWGSYFEKLRFPGQPESTQNGKFVMEWVMQPNNREWLIQRYYRIPLPAPVQVPAK